MTYRLVAHGLLEWPEVLALVAECQMAWADLDGFHIGSPPAEAPLATHAWAWRSGRWFRLYLDADQAIAGELTQHESDGREVEVVEHSGFAWGELDSVSPQPPSVRNVKTKLLEVLEPRRAYFVEYIVDAAR